MIPSCWMSLFTFTSSKKVRQAHSYSCQLSGIRTPDLPVRSFKDLASSSEADSDFSKSLLLFFRHNVEHCSRLFHGRVNFDAHPSEYDTLTLRQTLGIIF